MEIHHWWFPKLYTSIKIYGISQNCHLWFPAPGGIFVTRPDFNQLGTGRCDVSLGVAEMLQAALQAGWEAVKENDMVRPYSWIGTYNIMRYQWYQCEISWNIHIPKISPNVSPSLAADVRVFVMSNIGTILWQLWWSGVIRTTLGSCACYQWQA